MSKQNNSLEELIKILEDEIERLKNSNNRKELLIKKLEEKIESLTAKDQLSMFPAFEKAN